MEILLVPDVKAVKHCGQTRLSLVNTKGANFGSAMARWVGALESCQPIVDRRSQELHGYDCRVSIDPKPAVYQKKIHPALPTLDILTWVQLNVGC